MGKISGDQLALLAPLGDLGRDGLLDLAAEHLKVGAGVELLLLLRGERELSLHDDEPQNLALLVAAPFLDALLAALLESLLPPSIFAELDGRGVPREPAALREGWRGW